MKNRKLIFVLFILALASPADSVLAHGSSPAYLEVIEQTDGRLDITWKSPIVNGALLPIEPVFPPQYKQASPKSHTKAADAVIDRWKLACDEGELAGCSLSIKELESTTIDVLVRLKLKDNSIHRLVLRPTETAMVVPAAEEPGSRQMVMALLGRFDKWRFLILCLAGFLLSLFNKARKRGIVLCVTALVLGSLFGHTAASIAGSRGLLNTTAASDEQNRRIVHGLLLNTYRSCGYTEEELVYEQLARSVTGDLLSTVYLQNRDALSIDDAEGAKSIVDRVDVRSVESAGRGANGALSVVASWDVYGSVRHFGHTHYRCNSYKAELTIVPAMDYWKISNMQVLDEERVI